MRAELCRRQLRQDPVQMTADALRLLAEKFNLTPCSGDPRAGEGQGRQAGVWCSQYRFWRPAPETQMGCPFVRRPSLICMRLMPLKQKRTGSIPHVL